MNKRLLRRALLFVLLATLLLFFLVSCDNNTNDITNVRNSCVPARSWGAPELIETDNSGDAGNPQIAMNADGDAIAVWSQSDGTRNNIWANHYDGLSWGSAELIETHSGDADNPQIAMDADGKAIAVWVQDYDTEIPISLPPGFPPSFEVRPAILTNRFDGSAWSEVQVLRSDYYGNSRNPQITMNADGIAMAVWARTDYSNPFMSTAVYFDHFDGSAWSEAKAIQSNPYGHVYSAQIAMDANGQAIAVWVQDFSIKVRPAILAKRFDGSAWGEVQVLWIDYFGRARNPQITMNADGIAMAVCVSPSDDLSDEKLYVKAIRHDGLSWGAVEVIQTDISSSADNPQIAMDENGNAIAVWSQSDGTRNNIWANHFDGLSWGNPGLIETDNSGDAGNPQIAIDAYCNAIAVWSQSDGTRNNIWVNHFK